MLYWVHLAWMGFILTALVLIWTDCIGSWKSNYMYHTTTMTPYLLPQIIQGRRLGLIKRLWVIIIWKKNIDLLLYFKCFIDTSKLLLLLSTVIILFLETTTELIGTKFDNNVTCVVFIIVCDCHSIWKLMAPGANYFIYDFSEYSNSSSRMPHVPYVTFINDFMLNPRY
jgi:hypothetical protein